MVRNVLRLVLAVNSVSKALSRVEKIPILCVVNSNPRILLFMKYFCVKCVWSSDSKLNCSCLLISSCELIFGVIE